MGKEQMLQNLFEKKPKYLSSRLTETMQITDTSQRLGESEGKPGPDIECQCNYILIPSITSITGPHTPQPQYSGLTWTLKSNETEINY